MAERLEAHVRAQTDYALHHRIALSGARSVTLATPLHNLNTAEYLARFEALKVTAPPIGTRITLTYPKGAADKARVQRLLLRGLLYAVLLFMAAALVERLMGRLPAGRG